MAAHRLLSLLFIATNHLWADTLLLTSIEII